MALGYQPNAEGGADTVNRVETRFAVRAQSLVQGFACDASRLGDFRHAASAGNVAERGGQQTGVVRFQNVGQVGGDGRIIVEVLCGVELGYRSSTLIRLLMFASPVSPAVPRAPWHA